MTVRKLHNYTKTAGLLHWLIVGLVAALFCVGWFMTDLPRGAERGYFFALHKSLGLSLFFLMLLRLWWRYKHTPPPFPETVKPWQQWFASRVHVGFYMLLFIQPITGYLSSSFSGYSTKLFGLMLPSWASKNVVVNEFFTSVHQFSSCLLLLLIFLHIGGAISHVARDGMVALRRIRPW
jgi:cytochrome b561